MTSLAALLDDTAAAFPTRDAVVLGDTRLTYEQVNQAANQVSNLLVGRGINPGDRVALSCPNLPYFPVIYFGILKAGATVVALNVLLKSREIAYHLADSQAKAYFAFEGSEQLPIRKAAVEAVEATPGCDHLFIIDADPVSAMSWLRDRPTTFDTVDRDDEDTAAILYTSGTTGQPKGAELRHRNLRDNALAGSDLIMADRAVPDVYLCSLPLFHAFGQTAIQNCGFAFGATLVMLTRFDPVIALETMSREKVTIFPGVPAMYWALLDKLDDATDVDLDGLRVASSGAAPLPAEIHRLFQQRFGITILEGYGLSETSPIASFARWGEEPRVGSIGVPVPGVQMKLINEDWSSVADDPQAIGEIAIKGSNVMKGYFGRPEETGKVLRDGWFRTGDLARRDVDGFYYIVDRVKDLIIRGGFNVYPREIEELLMEHPAVSLVAVIGVPHESHGEEVKAFVVRNLGSTTTAQDLIAWARAQLASYKYPRVVEFVSELPMSATGKILKRELSRGSAAVGPKG